MHFWEETCFLLRSVLNILRYRQEWTQDETSPEGFRGRGLRIWPPLQESLQERSSST
jgi:hypothetical protein